MQKKILFILFFAVLVAIFAIHNSHPVLLEFFEWHREIPLIFIILASIVMGSLLMTLVTSIKHLKMNKEIKLLRNQNKELKEKIKELNEEINDVESSFHKDENSSNSAEKESNIELENNKDDINHSEEEAIENKGDESKSGANKKYRSLKSLKDYFSDRFFK